MSEIFKPSDPIIFEHATFDDDKVIINGEHVFSTLTPEKIDEMHETASIVKAPICHLENGVQVCVCSFNHEIPPSDPIDTTTNSVEIQLGRIVKNPTITKAVMEETALHQLTLLEKAFVPHEDRDRHLNLLVNQIEDISQRMHDPLSRRTAQHEAIRFIKRGKDVLPTVISAAVIFIANK